MNFPGYAAMALLAAVTLAGTPAHANMCKAEKLSCATTMPVDGYCECTAHGATESGTVVAAPVSRHSVKATAGGCGAHPDNPGCR